MPTIYREGGVRYVIYLDDHEPAHVHAISDGEARILLTPVVALDWQRGFTRAAVKDILGVVGRHRAAMLAEWARIHG